MAMPSAFVTSAAVGDVDRQTHDTARVGVEDDTAVDLALAGRVFAVGV